jgi:hypothetical protein
VRSALGLYNVYIVYQLRVAVVRSEKLVAEAGDSSGIQRKGNVRRWKQLSSNG